MPYLVSILFSVAAGLAAGKPAGGGPVARTYSYLALGDSYTAGESVKTEQSFPYLLRERLTQAGYPVSEPKVVAKTGWTTDELQRGIGTKNKQAPADFVTLLVGVNDQFRGYAPEAYRKAFRSLLVTAVSMSVKKEHVFVLSIPDWGVTPFAAQNGYTAAAVAREIDVFNAINREECRTAGISYTDITPGSRRAASDVSLIAGDGLHPSGKMYAEWAELLFPKVKAVL